MTRFAGLVGAVLFAAAGGRLAAAANDAANRLRATVQG